MTILQKLDHHADLMNRMAGAVDADIGDAMIRGALDGHELRGAVLRCTACEAAGECVAWLDAQDGAAVDTVPDFCANRDLMERLRA